MPYCCAHTREGGERHRGRSIWRRCAPVLPRPRLSAELVRARAVHIGPSSKQMGSKRYRCVPVLPRPTFRWGRPSSGRHTSDQATRHQAVHARTPTPPPFGGGRPSYKATCTEGQRQRHERPRVGVMRLMGVMTGHVNCLPLWHPKVQAIKIIIWWLLEQCAPDV